MDHRLIIVLAATTVLAACSPQREKTPADTPPPTAPAAASTTVPQNDPVVLGLTTAQIQGANLLSADQTDVGDVEKVDVNSEGKATGLIITPTGSGERWVRLPLEGLVVKNDGGDHVVITTMTLAQIEALPAWAP